MTRTYRSSLLSEPTRLEIVTRNDDMNLLGAVVNGEGYWIKRHGGGSYTVSKEQGEAHEVQADDMGGTCDCRGARFQKHHVCRHLVAIAVLRRDVRALAALLIAEVV